MKVQLKNAVSVETISTKDLIPLLTQATRLEFDVPEDEWTEAARLFNQYPNHCKQKKSSVAKHSFVTIENTLYAIQSKSDLAKGAPSPTGPNTQATDCLAKGGSSKVKLAKNHEGIYFALKITGYNSQYSRQSNRYTTLSLNEKAVLERLNIPCLKATKANSSNKANFFAHYQRKQYQILPLVPGQDLVEICIQLQDLKKRNPALKAESFVLSLVIESLKETAYLHNRGILHRDIKLDNFMLNRDGQVKIVDLATAKLLNVGCNRTQSEQSFVGTVGHTAPEIIEQGKTTKRYTHSRASDTFGFYETLVQLHKSCLIKYDLFIQHALIHLNKPPSQRMTLEDLIHCLTLSLKSQDNLSEKSLGLIKEHEENHNAYRVLKLWQKHCQHNTNPAHLGIENKRLVSYNMSAQQVQSVKTWLQGLDLQESKLLVNCEDPQQQRYSVVMPESLIKQIDVKLPETMKASQKPLETSPWSLTPKHDCKLRRGYNSL